jgi:DegV family protein with EDD domain
MADIPIIDLDGRGLYYTFIAGANKILENQTELNRINVFPVNDGDTGTNLASTIRSVLDQIRPHRSYKITADSIAEAALVGAQGNSGIIFAQFLYGMSVETGDRTTVTTKEFAEIIKRSVKYVFEAIAVPVEGTMLTVIKDWADHIYQHRERMPDFGQLMIGSADVLKRSLLETKTKLAVLAKANVVDAGAKGFVLFIEGIIEFIKASNIKALLRSHAGTLDIPDREEVVPEHVTLRYCTEAILKNSTLDLAALREILSGYGDSVVIAGSRRMCHFHLHTNSPADLFFRLQGSGTLMHQKADDMVRQSEAAYRRKWPIALVTDSTCDLSQELIDRYQIHMLPLKINFGDNHYLDKVTIQPEQFYALLGTSPDEPTTSQVNERSFVNLYSHLASHYDSVIALNISEHLSGTYGSSHRAARKIAKEFGKPITVINSRNLSGALGLLALRVAEAIGSGMTHGEIVRAAEGWVRQTKLLVSVRDLESLVRGGRVSHTKGFIAKALGINPIITIDERGKAHLFGKAYGYRSTMRKVMRHIRTISEGRKVWNYIVLHAHNERAAAWYTEEMQEFTGKPPVSTVNISPAVGVNAGIGASAVALMFE